ncbi:MAG: hypothetical protein H5T86_08320 [Armatimonadetes bacterium]|nr:hypothetical protein [Armatimonadota bacterium]
MLPAKNIRLAGVVLFSLACVVAIALCAAERREKQVTVECITVDGEWFVPAVKVFRELECDVRWSSELRAVVLSRPVRMASPGEPAGGEGQPESAPVWATKEVYASELMAPPRRALPELEGATALWNGCRTRGGVGYVALKRCCEALAFEVRSLAPEGEGPPWEVTGVVQSKRVVGGRTVPQPLLPGDELCLRIDQAAPPSSGEDEGKEGPPGLEAVYVPGLGQPVVTVTNRTPYTLYIDLKGPAQYSWRIGSGQSVTNTIPSGKYRFFATVRRSHVVPCSGTHVFSQDTRYDWTFFVR